MYPKIQIFLHFPDHARDLLVLADEDKLLQALVNILNNAGKFSKPGSTISMHCAFDDRYITITVEDHGSGIAKNDLSRIFDRFYRGKHTKQEGMGLGLYLVKQIIDKHNGHIDIHSVVNKGTTVIISLPTYTTNGT